VGERVAQARPGHASLDITRRGYRVKPTRVKPIW